MNARAEADRHRMLRADCAFFAEDVLGIEIGHHHEEWSDLIRGHQKISILAARGHGKSGFWSYAYPLWQSWRTPKNTGLIVSDTEAQVGEFFRIIKEGKEFTDPDTGHLWRLPAVCDVPFLVGMLPKGWERLWTDSKIMFANGARFVGKTFGSRFRGAHVRWIVVDDPLGDDNQYSELARSRDWMFLTRTIGGMLLPGGQQVVAGTPMHADDLHGKLAVNPEYVQRRYPALSVDPVTRVETVLWPEFRSRKWLDAKRREIGELSFGQEFLLSPATSEASLFPTRLFTQRRDTLDRSIGFRPSRETIEANGWTIVFGVDVAQSAEVGADAFVIVVLAVNDAGVRWVIDLVHETGLPFNSQLATLEDMAARYQPDLIYIESNASQRIYGDEMMRTTDLPIGKFVTSAGGKNNLESGVPGLRTLLENGRLRLARGDSAAIAGTDLLMSELGCFSWVSGKLQGVGAHDDTVMALWIADQAVRALRRMTFWTARGDGDVEEDEGDPLPPESDLPVAQAPLPVAYGEVDPDPDAEWLNAANEPPADAPAPGLRAPAEPAAPAQAVLTRVMAAATAGGAFRVLSPAELRALQSAEPHPGAKLRREAIHLGHVPSTCTVPDEDVERVLAAPIERGADPCELCTRPRGECKGRPFFDPDAWKKRRRRSELDDDDDEAPPTRPAAPPQPSAATVAAQAGISADKALLAALPRDRAIWISAWNASRTGVGMPREIAALVGRFGEAEVVRVLRGCLGV